MHLNLKPSTIVLLCVAGGALVLASRAVSSAKADLRHYNRLREMSGQGPLSEEVPLMAREILDKWRGLPRLFAQTLTGLPGDAARYLKIEAM